MENKVEKKVTDLKIYTKEIAEVKLNFTDNEVPKSYDLTNEEIDALSRAAYTSVDVNYNKKTKRYNYTLNVHLIANSLKFEIRMTLDQCRRIFASHGIEFLATKEYKDVAITSRVRFLHGTRDDGNVYVALQIFPLGNARSGKSRNLVRFLEFLTDEKIDVFELTKITNKKTGETKSFNEICLFWKNPEAVEVVHDEDLDYMNV